VTTRTVGGVGLVSLAAVAIVFLAIPVVGLVRRAIAGGALLDAVATPAVRDALILSLATTTISLGLAVALGTPLALLLARRRFRGSGLLETVVDLPIVLPPSVAGLALLIVFGRSGLVGSALEVAGIQIPFTTLAVILAQTFVAAPFFVRTARAGISSVDPQMEDAARDLGAAEASVIRRITLPLAAPALATGMVLCWSRALGEFGATIMFAGNLPGVTQTLPLVVFSEFQSGDLEASIAAAAILVLAAFGVLLAVRALRWGAALNLRGGGRLAGS
jgi:molybdate transport system permease protein